MPPVLLPVPRLDPINDRHDEMSLNPDYIETLEQTNLRFWNPDLPDRQATQVTMKSGGVYLIDLPLRELQARLNQATDPNRLHTR